MRTARGGDDGCDETLAPANRVADARRAVVPAPARRVASGFALLILGLLGVLAAFGCAVNPVTGRRELSLVSADQEANVGREGYTAVVAQYGVVDDPRLQAYVDSVGRRLAAVSHLPDLQWHFTLLDDDAVNAFAMPGGYVYITRGILAHLNSEAQLAGVMGHEIGHVTARHAAKQMTQQQLAGLGLGLAQAFSSTVRQISPAAQQALGLLMLKYSRDDETQADELGVTYATRAGWDPRVIPATYEMLGRISDQAGQRLPSYLSTHPDPGDRQTRTTQLAAAAVTGKTGLVVNERAYLQRLDGMLYGPDPRVGYVDGDAFYDPSHGVQMALPSGWQRQLGCSSITTTSSDPGAGFTAQVTGTDVAAPSVHDRIEGLKSAGKIGSAAGREEFLGGFPAWVGAVMVPADAGPTRMLLALVRISDTAMLEITGRSTAPDDAGERAILGCMRSVRPIDPRKLEPELMRLELVPAPQRGSFQSVVAGLGPQAIGFDETAILNQRHADQDVMPGELIKLVRKHGPH